MTPTPGWRTVGAPGALLIDGHVAGTWRPRKSGRRLTISVAPFAPLSSGDGSRVRAEAETLGPFRDASSVVVEIDPG